MIKLNIIIVFTSLLLTFYTINRVFSSFKVSPNSPRLKGHQNLRIQNIQGTQNININNYDEEIIRGILQKISLFQQNYMKSISLQKIKIEQQVLQLKSKLLEVMEKIKECEDKAKSAEVCALQYKISIKNSYQKLSNKQTQFRQQIQDLEIKSNNNLSRIQKIKEQYKQLLYHHINLKEKVCDQICKQNELITLKDDQKQLNNEIQYINKQKEILDQYISQIQEQYEKLDKELATKRKLDNQIISQSIFSLNFLQNLKYQLTDLHAQYTLTNQQYSILKSIFSLIQKKF